MIGMGLARVSATAAPSAPIASAIRRVAIGVPTRPAAATAFRRWIGHLHAAIAVATFAPVARPIGWILVGVATRAATAAALYGVHNVPFEVNRWKVWRRQTNGLVTFAAMGLCTGCARVVSAQSATLSLGWDARIAPRRMFFALMPQDVVHQPPSQIDSMILEFEAAMRFMAPSQFGFSPAAP